MDITPTASAAHNTKRTANRVLVKTEQLPQRYLDTMARRNLAVDTREFMDSYNIKQTVDLAVECWNDITPATIHHAWCNILKGLPDCRWVQVPGIPQMVEAELEGAVEEARHIPGAGFADITRGGIREMLHPPEIIAREILEEDVMNDGEIDENQQETTPEEVGLSIGLPQEKSWDTCRIKIKIKIKLLLDNTHHSLP
ncbi:hypothetical protein E2C01_060823 [Portunus trituberculatus]|uniref:DDE-1 domain-containing protein n=1 Tax=Portunus trituberculatus TaxID=210409 RepID=A0A5B7H6J8_PORTR|nr:hypothetical protein [Portunus trituberculatus]